MINPLTKRQPASVNAPHTDSNLSIATTNLNNDRYAERLKAVFAAIEVVNSTSTPNSIITAIGYRCAAEKFAFRSVDKWMEVREQTRFRSKIKGSVEEASLLAYQAPLTWLRQSPVTLICPMLDLIDRAKNRGEFSIQLTAADVAGGKQECQIQLFHLFSDEAYRQGIFRSVEHGLTGPIRCALDSLAQHVCKTIVSSSYVSTLTLSKLKQLSQEDIRKLTCITLSAFAGIDNLMACVLQDDPSTSADLNKAPAVIYGVEATEAHRLTSASVGLLERQLERFLPLTKILENALEVATKRADLRYSFQRLDKESTTGRSIAESALAMFEALNDSIPLSIAMARFDWQSIRSSADLCRVLANGLGGSILAALDPQKQRSMSTIPIFPSDAIHVMIEGEGACGSCWATYTAHRWLNCESLHVTKLESNEHTLPFDCETLVEESYFVLPDGLRLCWNSQNEPCASSQTHLAPLAMEDLEQVGLAAENKGGFLQLSQLLAAYRMLVISLWDRCPEALLEMEQGGHLVFIRSRLGDFLATNRALFRGIDGLQSVDNDQALQILKDTNLYTALPTANIYLYAFPSAQLLQSVVPIEPPLAEEPPTATENIKRLFREEYNRRGPLKEADYMAILDALGVQAAPPAGGGSHWKLFLPRTGGQWTYSVNSYPSTERLPFSIVWKGLLSLKIDPSEFLRVRSGTFR